MNDDRIFRDYRTPTQREEYNKYINHITRDDTYRMFLQQNANKIATNEWNYLVKQNYCHPKPCVHIYPTRTLPSYFAKEREAYNQLAKVRQPPMANCANYKDYRMITIP